MRTYRPTFRRLSIIVLSAGLTGVLFCSPPHVRTGTGSLAEGRRGQVVETAKRYLGIPYRYGGESPDGFDCSGFVMYVYDRNGLRLPRATAEQYRSGRPVSRRSLRPGDLVFFSIRGGRISHVGIYAGGESFIHAPSSGKCVSFARLDNDYWRKRYAGAVTYFSRGGRSHYALMHKN